MSLYEYQATLARVVDGDTYDLNVDCGFKINFTERFRLYGADTPEKYGARASEEGKIASEFVERLLKAQGEVLSIKTFKDRKGKYGRYLVDIMLAFDADGQKLAAPTCLSDYLISEGMAEPYEK